MQKHLADMFIIAYVCLVETITEHFSVTIEFRGFVL